MEPTTTTAVTIATLVAEIASGPAAATVILAVLFGGLIYGFFLYGLPAINRSLDTHKKALDDIIAANKENLNKILEQHASTNERILAEHRADREAWQRSIEKINDRLEDVEDAVKDLKR